MNGPVTVFGASGRQGLAQIAALQAAGHAVRAVSRGAQAFPPGVEVVAADYNDSASLELACANSRAVFFTAPAFAEQMKGVRHARNLGRAAFAAGVPHVVFNTSSFVPDTPIGQPGYDARLRMEDALAASGVVLTVFRPVLFMDNMLTMWCRPFIARENAFVYPHRPGLEANWIALTDVAAFMVRALDRPEARGRRIVIGGPERLTPERIAATLSKVLNRTIQARSLSPRAFGELLYTIFESVTDAPRETYVQALDDFYTFNNAPGFNPFLCDAHAPAAEFGVTLTRFEDWAAQQDWSAPQPGAGPSGG